MTPRIERKVLHTICCFSTLTFLTMTWYTMGNIQQSFMMNSYYEVCKDQVMLLVNMIGLCLTMWLWGKVE